MISAVYGLRLDTANTFVAWVATLSDECSGSGDTDDTSSLIVDYLYAVYIVCNLF